MLNYYIIKFFIIYFLFTSFHNAQTANISGHVGTKHTKADLAGAKVEIINPYTNITLDEKITDESGMYTSIVSDVKKTQTLPNKLSVTQNYPNPFNPTSLVKVSIIQPGNYKFELFNSIGELIDKESNMLSSGTHTFSFSTPSAGIFFYRLSSNNFSVTKKAASTAGHIKKDYIELLSSSSGTMQKNTGIEQNNSTTQLDSLIARYSADNHITQQMKIAAVDQEVNVLLEQIPLEEINFNILTYDTAGDIAQPTFEYVWGDGSIDTVFANESGVIAINKKFYDSVTDREVSITQINPNFTGYVSLLDTSKTEMNHITQNWPDYVALPDTADTDPINPETASAILNIDQAKEIGTLESYSVPRFVDGYDMISALIRSILGRTIKYEQDYLSKFMPSKASDTTDIFLFREEFGNTSNTINPELIEKVKNDINVILAETTLKNGKKILKYNFYVKQNQFNPEFNKVVERGFDNLFNVQIDNFNEIPESGTKTNTDSTSLRIKSGYVRFDTLATSLIRKGMIYTVLTNTQHPYGASNPSAGNRIEDFIFTKEGTPTNLFRQILGINYTSLPGREY